MSERRIAGPRARDYPDGQIAAIARLRGMAVATRDVRDFADPGVAIINPWNP